MKWLKRLRALIWLILSFAVLGVLVGARGVSPPENKTHDFLGTDTRGGVDDADVWLLSVAATIPLYISIGAIAAYVVTTGNHRAAIIVIICILLVALIAMVVLLATFKFNTASHVSVDTYNELCQRMHRAANVPSPPAPIDLELQAHNRVEGYGTAFINARDKRGLQWLVTKGYLDLYRLVHRAEEALIMYEPVDLVLADGLLDVARLTDSTIPKSDDRIKQVLQALTVIAPATAPYLSQLPAHVISPPDRSTGATDDEQRKQDEKCIAARVILRSARSYVNTFRDTRRLSLVQARNSLVSTLFVTSCATLLLLLFVLAGLPPAPALLTGAVLYAIGAIVGLFNRLYSNVGSVGVVEDYGIFIVRLFQTALVSGLAGVLGVYIAIALPAALNDPVLRQQIPSSITATMTTGAVTPIAALTTTTPAKTSRVLNPQASLPVAPITPTVTTTTQVTSSATPTATPPTSPTATPPTSPTATPPSDKVPPPIEVYDLNRYPFDIVLAAIFGLTPGLLISRLSQSTNQAKRDLHSSEAGSQAPRP